MTVPSNKRTGQDQTQGPGGTRHVSLYTHSVPQPFLIPTNPVTREAEILSSNLTGAEREGGVGAGRGVGVLGRLGVVEIKPRPGRSAGQLMGSSVPQPEPYWGAEGGRGRGEWGGGECWVGQGWLRSN